MLLSREEIIKAIDSKIKSKERNLYIKTEEYSSKREKELEIRDK